MPGGPLTVSDAEARLVADTKLDHVRLTDLMLTCTDRENRSGRIYVSALGEQPLPDVLVEFDASEACEAGPLRVAGRLERRWRTADGRPAATDVPRTLLFHPHTGDLVWRAMSTALTILGGVLMWSGLRRRRAERERLRKATEPGRLHGWPWSASPRILLAQGAVLPDLRGPVRAPVRPR